MIRDNLIETSAIVVAAVLVASLVGRVAGGRFGDAYQRYYARKIVRFVVVVVAAIGLGIVWRPFAGQLGLFLGLIAAGLAFAMQEIVGALAGWFNIVVGGIYRVGDRVEVGGVRGDVLDISPLRTKLMEMGSSTALETTVRGRQYTGRIVTVSNKASLTDPVYNYSGAFEFIWEELTLPVAYADDWRLAERILHEEAVRVSTTEGATAAIRAMSEHYPVAPTDVEPRVFLRATDNYLELSARFVVPVRTTRLVCSELTRTVLERLEAAGIAVASTTQDVTVRSPPTAPQ